MKLQRLMTHALVRPLTAKDGMQSKWIDGRAMADVAAEYIKTQTNASRPSNASNSNNRMYWFRLIDIMHDDNPGMHALLGRKNSRG